MPNEDKTNEAAQKWLDMISSGRWVEIEKKDPAYPSVPKHVPDPKWEELDSEGHVHRYVVTHGVLTIPTLVFVELMGHFVCKQCGQRIEPGRMTVYSKGTGWIVNGKSVGDAVGKKIAERLGRE